MTSGYVIAVALRLSCIISLISITASLAEIIPQERRITWDPGIPGGMTNRTTIGATVSADTTGVIDASSAIQGAINACPVGQVVFIPAGTYRMNSKISITKGITLRGAGTLQTLLRSYVNDHAIQVGNYPASPVATNVFRSPAKGATSITVSSITTPALSVGDHIVIDQINEGTEVVNVDDFSRDGNTRCLSQITKITAINGLTLTISPALYHAYSASQNPQIWKLGQTNGLTVGAGLENFTVERVSPTGLEGVSNVLMVCCIDSWIYNIQSNLAQFRHVDLDRSFHCTVEHSYFNDGQHHDTGGFAYGVVCSNRATANLIQNNIFRRLRHSMVVKEGACGNVYGYNYSFDTYQGDGFLAPDLMLHGAHANQNLYEGNCAVKADADFTHGSSSYNTFFRNYLTRATTAETISNGGRVVNLDYKQTYFNFVGNVLGAPSLTWTAEETGATRSSSSNYIWSLGFNGDGDTTRDTTEPGDTLFRHGNYSARTGTVTWDSGMSDHNIPSSLYLASKPSWFGSLAWPPYEPVSGGTASPEGIPAGASH